MPRWHTHIDLAPWQITIEAGYVGIEYGALVFRTSPTGDLTTSYAAGHWKSVEQVVDAVVTPDVFGNATREIVQG